jgi:hypothetical protein
MSATTPTPHIDLGDPDLQLPEHGQVVQRRLPAPARALGAAAGAVGTALMALVYLIGAPLVATATGVSQILLEVRETAVRPRPFLGARHGFPFLDPRPVPVVVETPTADTEE